MSTVTVSSKFQVVIPKDVREYMHLKPGQRLAVICRGRTISLVPVLTLDELQGFAKGINIEGLREETDRL